MTCLTLYSADSPLDTDVRQGGWPGQTMDWANAYVPLDDDQKDSWRDLFLRKICYTVVLAVHHGIFDKDLLKLALAAHSCMNFSALMQQYN